MDTGSTWGDGAAYPHGIEARFAEHRLDTVFGSFDAFITAAQWYQFANLKYEIEVMRAHPSIMGYVITEFTDVHWESNGLLDMNRNPRAFHDQFGTINADVVIVPQVSHYSGTAGEAVQFGLGIATGSTTLPGTTLHWQTDSARGTLPVPAAGPTTLADAGQLALTLPETPTNRMLRFDFSLHLNGREIARNHVEIGLYAKRSTTTLPALHCTDPDLAAHARALGYDAADAPDATDRITLTHALDAADITRMQQGAHYVVLADGTAKTQGNLRLDAALREQPFIPIVDATPGLPRGSESQLPNINLIARQGTMWRGDWIAGFSWIRRQGAFAHIPGGPLLDLSFDRVVPHHVMTGFRAWEYGGAVHAGTNVGWLHKPAALIASRRVGRGGLVACTFRLRTAAAGADPVASALFDAVIAQAATLPREATT